MNNYRPEYGELRVFKKGDSVPTFLFIQVNKSKDIRNVFGCDVEVVLFHNKTVITAINRKDNEFILDLESAIQVCPSIKFNDVQREV